MIPIPQVRVVDEEGAQLGVMPTAQALALAQERGYDLVEVAPMASPPVVNSRLRPVQVRADEAGQEAKRRQRSVTFKEVRLTPKIGLGDFDTKVHRAIEFLEDGDQIKVTVRFRGRELTHPELGRNMLARFTDRIKEHGTPERAPLLEGKSMHLTVASVHKPKEHEAPASHRDRMKPEAPRTNGAAPDSVWRRRTKVEAPAPVAAKPTETKIAETKPAETKEPAAAATPTETKEPVAAAAKPAETKQPAAAEAKVAVAAGKPATAAASGGEGDGNEEDKDAPAADPPAATGE